MTQKRPSIGLTLGGLSGRRPIKSPPPLGLRSPSADRHHLEVAHGAVQRDPMVTEFQLEWHFQLQAQPFEKVGVLQLGGHGRLFLMFEIDF